MSYLSYLCLFVYICVKHVLTIRVTRRVTCKRHELPTLREHQGSHPAFGVVCVAHLCTSLCHVCQMLPVSLESPLLIAPSVFSDVYLSKQGGD